MAKKSGITTATNKITGIGGKGPYMAREVMTGSKCMSAKHPGFDTNQPARMNSSHGLTGKEPPRHNMNQGGSNRIGAGTRTFKHEAYPTAGPKGNYPRHASQPSGHKSKA